MPRAKRPCRICGEPANVGSASRAEPAHNACLSASRPHGTALKYSLDKCRCDECKAAANAGNRQFKRGYLERNGITYDSRPTRKPSPPHITSTCQRCGTTYTGWGEKFCSRQCYDANRWATPRELVPLPVQPPRPHPTWEGSSVTKGWVFVSGPCTWCGQHFTMPHQQRARYCSKRCSKAAGRASGRFSIPDLIRRAIYQRDNWTCQLCEQPVDRTGNPWGDWAPSLDHVECQSWVLIPDHRPDNLRTVHRWCNSARSNTPGPFDPAPALLRRSLAG